MSKKLELNTGQKFNHWTVMQEDIPNKNGRRYLCQCDCGDIHSLNLQALIEGRTKCCKKCNFEDLTGKRFGRLTVIERTDNKQNRITWRCICDCGNEVLVISKSLKNNNTKSCGCLNAELAKIRATKYNNYNLNNEYGIGYDSLNNKFYFDLEDYNKLKKYYWYKANDGYIIAHYNDDTYIKMHNLVISFDSKYEVDHKNGLRYDNRKINLRPATSSQQKFNQKLSKANKSGVKGVYWDNTKQKWCAKLECYHKVVCCKTFEKFNDAVEYRKIAEDKYFKEFKRLEKDLYNGVDSR